MTRLFNLAYITIRRLKIHSLYKESPWTAALLPDNSSHSPSANIIPPVNQDVL